MSQKCDAPCVSGSKANPKQRLAFRKLSELGLAPLVPVGDQRVYREGECLLSPAAQSERFFLVAWGRLKACFQTREGRCLILGLYGPGDTVGFAGAISRRPVRAAVMAAEDSGCLVVHRDRFLELLSHQTELLAELLPLLTRQLCSCTNCLVESVCSSVEIRFARLFLRLVADASPDGAGGLRIAVRLSRRELSELTGTTAESCSRLMSRWRREGVVLTSDEGFLVRDLPALKEIALS